MLLLQENILKSIFMKVDTEAKLKGLQLLPNEFFMLVIKKLRNIEFAVGLKPILPLTF